MISGVSITDQGDGQFLVNYHTTTANVSVALVKYGADTAYGLTASGSATVNPSGGSDCSTLMAPGADPFHFMCVAYDGDTGAEDDSADQAYPPSGTQSDPVVSAVTQMGAVVSWTSSATGTGLVLYTDPSGKTWQQPDDADGSSTSHQATLADLLPGSAYSFQIQTDFDDDSLATVTSGAFNFSTQAGDPPVTGPGHVQVGASPTSVAVGGSSVVTVQIVQKKGGPHAGVPVAFSLGGGKAEGTLSADSGTTDATGCCSTTFNASGLPNKRKKAHRFVVALSGDPSGKQKRRKAMVLVTLK